MEQDHVYPTNFPPKFVARVLDHIWKPKAFQPKKKIQIIREIVCFKNDFFFFVKLP